MLAVAELRASCTGRAAHAAAFPERGINAADAVTVAQIAIGLLRQHLPNGQRVHGIVTDGGTAPNVIPEHAAATYLVRAGTADELPDLETKVRACFEAGALATGARVTVDRVGPVLTEFVHDREIGDLYRSNAERLGRVFAPVTPELDRQIGLGDMANVSRAVPAIHPMLDIDAGAARNHQANFTAAAAGPAADRAVRDGGVAMAWIAIDLATTSCRARLLAGRSGECEVDG